MTELLTQRDHIATIRWQRGWAIEHGRWVAPDGTCLARWRRQGHPLPEEPGYDAFVATYWHYEAMDAGL